MYIPKPYLASDADHIKSFVQQYPFGILVDQMPARLWAVHIPFEWEVRDGKDYLVGHIAKANPLGQFWGEARNVLAIFQGPHTYISSSWYREEEVPTWDYLAVHVYGSLRCLSEEETMASLKRLVHRHEAGEENPIDLEQFSESTLRQVRGVIGFEIEISESQGVAKLSQTRAEDHDEIRNRLKKRGDEQSQQIADEIQKRNPS
jgi:transcriptional regulator